MRWNGVILIKFWVFDIMLLFFFYIFKIIGDEISFKWNMYRLGMNRIEVGGFCWI